MRKLHHCSHSGGHEKLIPSNAWITTTVRDNILFGKEFNKISYNEVTEVAGLVTDLDT